MECEIAYCATCFALSDSTRPVCLLCEAGYQPDWTRTLCSKAASKVASSAHSSLYVVVVHSGSDAYGFQSSAPDRATDVADDTQRCITDSLLVLLAFTIILGFMALFLRHFSICLKHRQMYRASRGWVIAARTGDFSLGQNDELYANLLVSVPQQRSFTDKTFSSNAHDVTA